MQTRTFMLITALLAGSAADAARAADPAQAPPGDQAREHSRQRLRDGTGAGAQARVVGATGATARGTCDGTIKRDRLHDGSAGGRQAGRSGARR